MIPGDVFYTIPSSFKDNKELLEYWHECGYQAEFIDAAGYL